ncbi:hypothetical protein BDQ17DRAFT_1431885 [Cyathus striatus]|nr:hypothetical protein BDQ17DRAFT_1431885 [Cyathus striatus]
MAVSAAPNHDNTSHSFIPPSLHRDGGAKNIVDIISHHIIHNANHPLFQYADANRRVHHVTWEQISNALQSVVQSVQDRCDIPPTSSKPYIIGILANTDSITYFCLIFGIMLAGCVPFPVSPRNSADSVAHLLSVTNCQAVFISEDQGTQDLYNTSFRFFEDAKYQTFNVPALSSLLEPRDRKPSLNLPHNVENTSFCIIYHSSGSSGHPKCIYITHEIIFKWGIVLAYRDSNFDIGSDVVSIHGLPFYHAMSYCQMLDCIVGGSVASVFPPIQNMISLSPGVVLDAAVSSHSNMMFTFPSFLEAWSKNPEHIKALKKFKSIMFGGGPTASEVGETLFREGVPLSPMYGTTETGPVAVVFRSGLQSLGWDWMKTHPGIDLAFFPVEDGLYKLENELKKLTVSNIMVDGVPAFDTADIVARHPTDPTLWKVIGREDTLIVHSTGEKTNPIPIEECLQQDERVAAAIMFGREQLQAGVIILPAEGNTFDTADIRKVNEYRDTIWDVVQQANMKAPAHSRIFKEMIIIASSNRPFDCTDKGYPKRHAILREYKKEVEKLYNDTDVEIIPDGYDMSIGDGSDLNTIKDFVRSVVSLTMSRTIGDNDNIFSCGADSLCAASIRTNILRMITRKQPSQKATEINPILPLDLVFTHPTIHSLSSFISQLPIWLEPKELTGILTSDMTSANAFDLWTVKASGLVKFKNGNGEIPLILLPAVSGSSNVYMKFQEMYKSAVWSLDITHEPPTKFESIHHLASFYYQQIKRERPVGPYRFASFSGSSIILLYLVRLLEQSGDEVLQIAFLDHFPSVYLQGVIDPTIFNPNTSATDLDNYLRRNLMGIHKTLLNTRKRAADADAALAWLADGIQAMLHNEPIIQPLDDTIKRIMNTISICIKFLFGEELRLNGEWSRDVYISWLKFTKTEPVVYLTTEGTCSVHETPDVELASGLGAKEAYPNGRVVVVPGDHYDVLSSETVIEDLKRGFI